MRKLATILLLAIATISMAQSTDRKFVLKNSEDGKSELTVYLPKKPTGRAVVNCPGGGYSHLSMQNEGHGWAEFYNSQGIAFILLQYRMPNGDRNIPLTDAYNAMKTVRDSAAVWRINPHDVGIVGYSAGGHLASAVSTHAPMNLRPDFTILFYPVITMTEKLTHKGSVVGFLGDKRSDEELVKEWSSDRAIRRHLTPPAIVLLSNDDKAVPPHTNGVAYYSNMRKQGNECSLFAYPSGGHGWGCKPEFKFRDMADAELLLWLSNLKAPAPNALKVACIGNSITDGAGIDMAEVNGYPAVLKKHLGSSYYVKNFGLSGRTALNHGNRPYQAEPAWKNCLEWAPDVAVIKLGTNDTKPENRGFIATELEKDVQQMIDALRAANPKVRIILASPIPAYENNWNMPDSIITDQIMPIYQNICKKNKIEFLDLHAPLSNHKEMVQADGIHPNEKGAAEMAKVVAAAIKK